MTQAAFDEQEPPTQPHEAGTAGYLAFDRKEWAALRASTPLTLSKSDLKTLRSVNEDVSLQEVVDAFLPLSRLLNLHVSRGPKPDQRQGRFPWPAGEADAL